MTSWGESWTQDGVSSVESLVPSLTKRTSPLPLRSSPHSYRHYTSHFPSLQKLRRSLGHGIYIATSFGALTTPFPSRHVHCACRRGTEVAPCFTTLKSCLLSRNSHCPYHHTVYMAPSAVTEFPSRFPLQYALPLPSRSLRAFLCAAYKAPSSISTEAPPSPWHTSPFP